MALSATGVIFLPTTAKFALQSGSDVLSVAFARGVVATIILFIVALLLGLRLRIPRRLLLPSIVVGIAAALFVYGMYRAILTINISLALLILVLYPLMVASWEHFNGAARVRPLQWVWGVAALGGLVLILGVRFEQVSIVGVAMALMAMFATVVITLVNTRITETTGSLVANLYMSLWTLLLFGSALLAVGAGILGVTRASMITLLEPMLAAVFAWMIFGESFSPVQWAGFAAVMASLYQFEKLAMEKS